MVLVLEHVHGDARLPQRLGHGIHLGERRPCHVEVTLADRDVGLEGVVGGCRRVGSEAFGADQNYRAGGLGTHRREARP